MRGSFQIERLQVPAGGSTGTIDAGLYFLSMTDVGTAFVEWGAEGVQRRRRDCVLAGDFFVWPPGQPWWARLEAAKICLHFSFSAPWLRQITHSSFTLPPQVQRRDRLVAQMLRTLADVATRLPANPTTDLYQESLGTTLALHLVTHHGQTANKQPGAAPLGSFRLRQLVDYVLEHLADPISLGDLTRLAGLSASQFSLRFRATTGQTPHQFVTGLRVERARELLLAGQHTPAETAVLTGFADQSHLTRHVRRAFGVTPAALRKQRVRLNLGRSF